ncbi:hypothetical protein G4B88_029464 [Cannabis sativa]|uniref:DUF1985 domain-containing protein n=1 Tax=Cannabis sativa TaxID=3483 RepID=A0A7J6FFJ5_CANSA|nr:hypothetical protein G4B88_029464 [Cannabis sativa]
MSGCFSTPVSQTKATNSLSATRNPETSNLENPLNSLFSLADLFCVWVQGCEDGAFIFVIQGSRGSWVDDSRFIADDARQWHLEKVKSRRELPCIPRAITTNTAAKSKVTIKSSLSVIGQIKNWLTKSDQDVFKHYSQLGRLLDLDTKGLFPGTLVNQIVLRRVDCQKRHELWFLINGKPVRFSLQEFAIVSGFYTDGGPTPEEMELVSSKNKLKEKYFKNMMSIKVTDVANALDSISRESKTRDRVKLCFIYLLSAFLIMPSPSSAINLEWLQLVDNLPIFDNYCWGKLAYEKIIEQITKKDMKNNPSEKDIKWNLFSCPWIFLIWICEAMPKLGEVVGQRVPGNHIPRWLVAPANTVPLNKRTGDCGVFMLKTMEMHIAGKCNESATMLLNDDNIDTYRKAYAVQLYVGSADP